MYEKETYRIPQYNEKFLHEALHVIKTGSRTTRITASIVESFRYLKDSQSSKTNGMLPEKNCPGT
jgi:hypothetical protein